MKRKIIFSFVVAVLAGACSTLPKDIPVNLTVMELVQRAQEASDRNNYKRSLVFYNCILERYPFDNEAVCGAKYEIAFIHYKQKKFDEAKKELNAILERYNQRDSELLPAKFRILSEIVLESITAKQKAPFKKITSKT